MSSYIRKTKNPKTGSYENAHWIDDCFGLHKYGVKFEGQEILREDNFIWEFADDDIDSGKETNPGKCIHCGDEYNYILSTGYCHGCLNYIKHSK